MWNYTGQGSTVTLVGTRPPNGHVKNKTWYESSAPNVGVWLKGQNVGVEIEGNVFEGHVEDGVKIGDPANPGNDSEGLIFDNLFKSCRYAISFRTNQTKGWYIQRNHMTNNEVGYYVDGFMSPVTGGSCGGDFGSDVTAGVLVDANKANVSPIHFTGVFCEGIGSIGWLGRGNQGSAHQPGIFRDCRFLFHADTDKHETHHLETHVRTSFDGCTFFYTGGSGAPQDPLKIRRFDAHPLFFWNCLLPTGGVEVTGAGDVIINGVLTTIADGTPTIVSAPY